MKEGSALNLLAPWHRSPGIWATRRRRHGIEVLENRTLLAVTVDTLVDEMDGRIDDDDISLRDALDLAPAGETIDFDESLDGGTILLTLGELSVTKALTIDASALALGLTINASGNDPTPGTKNGDGSRAFEIDDGNAENSVDVVIKGLTLTGGDEHDDGGAIRSAENLTVAATKITNNRARFGSGGGISANGNLTLIRSSVSGNEAALFGGGLSASGGLTIDSSAIWGNVSSNFAGGIHVSVQSDTTTITNTTVGANSALQAGGILVDMHNDGVVTIQYSTISKNDVAGHAGGIWARDIENDGGEINVKGSIIGGNHADTTARDLLIGNKSTLAASFSLIGENTGSHLAEAPAGSPDANGNLIGGPVGGAINPMLGPLRANGGPTPTMALRLGGPAIDAGDPNFSPLPDFDQRGDPWNRVANGRIDMGAYERQDVVAGSLVVNTLVDEFDGNVADGDISLRDAMAAAPATSTILFDVSLNGGTIFLDSTLGELTIDTSLTIDATGLPDGVTIDASTADPTPDDDQGDGIRIFNIDDGDDFTLHNVAIVGLTLTGGDSSGNGGGIRSQEILELRSSTIHSNNTLSRGGGIYSRDSLTIDDSTISTNDGAGIHARGTVTITDSTISGNNGVGVEADDGSVIGSTISENAGVGVRGISTITGSMITDNARGGIQAYNVTISGSTVARNSHGGGIYSPSAGNITVNSSTISGNSAARGGAGIRTYEEGYCDGFLCYGPYFGEVTILNSTITGNSAEGSGGGILGGNIAIENSIVADNSDDSTAPDLRSGYGTIAPTHSLIGDKTGTALVETGVGSPDANGNQIGNSNGMGTIDPLLGPLADNGGLTWTHALLPNSPAIEAGDPAFASPPQFDQRGEPFARIFGDRIDIGAYEANLVVDIPIDENDGDYSLGDLSLREAIEIANSSRLNTVTFNPALSGSTILLTLGQLAITESLTIDAADLPGGLTIDASGNDPTPGQDNGDGSRVFFIDSGKRNRPAEAQVYGLTLTGGDVHGHGGAILAFGTQSIASSTITGNSSERNGGGIYIDDGDLSVADSAMSGNSADDGGGIFARNNVTVTNSTISGNAADYDGGGIRGSGEVTVTSSTISGNQARHNGGGIWTNTGNIIVANSIVVGNTAHSTGPDLRPGTGTLSVRYSLIGDNTRTGLAEAPVGSPDANGNLIGDPSGMGIIDPMLGSLAYKGGPTQTHALLPGSPAIDMGDPSFTPPPEFDQRGSPFTRVAAGRIDMGAFEAQVTGDMEFDGDMDFDDIDPFVLGLKTPTAYEQQYGVPPATNGDTDSDGDFDFDDIPGFAGQLTGPTFIGPRIQPVALGVDIKEPFTIPPARSDTDVSVQANASSVEMMQPGHATGVSATPIRTAGASTDSGSQRPPTADGRRADGYWKGFASQRIRESSSDGDMAFVWAEDLDWLNLFQRD